LQQQNSLKQAKKFSSSIKKANKASAVKLSGRSAGLFFVDSAQQRRMGIKDSVELAMQDWFGSAQFDREDEDCLGTPMGRSVCQLCGWREASVSERTRTSGFPGCRLGRARRQFRDWARKLSSSVPHHVGHGPCTRWKFSPRPFAKAWPAAS
jgi:predicted oxidoreductase